ncbi:unnamed protein product, partial [Iphiclides podalirius]
MAPSLVFDTVGVRAGVERRWAVMEIRRRCRGGLACGVSHERRRKLRRSGGVAPGSARSVFPQRARRRLSDRSAPNPYDEGLRLRPPIDYARESTIGPVTPPRK